MLRQIAGFIHRSLLTTSIKSSQIRYKAIIRTFAILWSAWIRARCWTSRWWTTCSTKAQELVRRYWYPWFYYLFKIDVLSELQALRSRELIVVRCRHSREWRCSLRSICRQWLRSLVFSVQHISKETDVWRIRLVLTR